MLTKLCWTAVILTPLTAMAYVAGGLWLFLAGVLIGTVIGAVSTLAHQGDNVFMR